MKRQLFVDTETTGLDYKKGHRIIELGAVELVNRKRTGRNLHFYFRPDIEVDEAAFKVHGINNNFLQDKPLFSKKINEILQYFKHSELIVHNSKFDIPFLNWEISLLSSDLLGKIEDYCPVVDTLSMARKRHPGQKNSLDALCTRYAVNNKHRKLHGALLDAEILADVYLAMTGGQTELFSEVLVKNSESKKTKDYTKTVNTRENFLGVKAKISDSSQRRHEKYLTFLDKESDNNTLWRKL